MSKYNGWANYATWNVALWLGNDEGLYRLACEASSYAHLVELLRELGSIETPDCVAWNDRSIDTDALDDMMREFRDDDDSDETEDDDDVDISGYDYNWHGYSLTIRVPQGTVFLQGDEAAEVYDRLEATTSNRQLLAILSAYEDIAEPND